MKKILAAVLAAAMMLGMAACTRGGSGPSSASGVSGQSLKAETAVSGDPTVIRVDEPAGFSPREDSAELPGDSYLTDESMAVTERESVYASPCAILYNQDNQIMSGPAAAEPIEIKYSPQHQNIFDLYLNHSRADPEPAESKSTAEFPLGRRAAEQGWNWACRQAADTKSNTADNAPIDTGIPRAEKQDPYIGTENLFWINRMALREKRPASAGFMDWLYTGEEGEKPLRSVLLLSRPLTSSRTGRSPPAE